MQTAARRTLATLLAAATALLTACSSTGINTEPFGFAFVDAVTGQPVQGVEVTASRRANREAFAEQADGARTGLSGRAMLNLRPAPFIDVLATAPGYQRSIFEIQRDPRGLGLNGLSLSLAMPLDEEQSQEFNGALAWRIALVPSPPLHVQLVVPEGFRGLVRVVYPSTVSYDEPVPGLVGPRDSPRTQLERERFAVVRISPEGVARLPDSWLLATPHTFSAVDHEGKRIPGPEGAMARGASEYDIRLRGGIDLMRADFFVVGSLREYEQALAREFRLDR